MSGTEIEVIQLKKTIEMLTQDIEKKINQNDFTDTNNLITQRLQCLKQLMSMIPVSADKKALENYLTNLYQKDQKIMNKMKEELELIKSSLSNFHKLIDYNNQI
ncbi:MAG: hypothetical protein ABI597_01335 [Gammaproteobacteria bacterium]